MIRKMQFKWDRASVTAVALVVLIILIRLMLLDWNPDRLSPDHSIVSLMSKHIYEKGEYPFFFYGQNWFGSMESFMHAFFFSIFGISTKALGYAPLFFFSLFLFILYLLTRDLFNSSTALWSMSYFIVPPIYLLDYSLNPQGGYIETLTFGALIFWLTVRLIQSRISCHIGWLSSLGLAAGLGWWTSPLTIYFILTSFIFILMTQRLKLLNWKILFGLAGFFIGSFPFWLFHILYHQDLGGFSTGFHPNIIPRGIQALFSHDIPAMLDWKHFKRKGVICSGLFLIFYLGSTWILLLRTGHDFLKIFRLKSKEVQGKGILLLFFIIFCVIYASSGHSLEKRERYVLPLFIFFPIAAGLFFVWLREHRPARMLVWLISACIVFVEVSLFERYINANLHDYKRRLGLQRLENFMLKQNLFFCYTDYGRAPVICFLSKEKIIATTLGYEKYPPYQSLADQALSPAILLEKNSQEEERLEQGLNYLGGRLKIDLVSGFMVLHSYEAPVGQYTQIDPENWNARTSHHSKNVSFAFDRNAGRKWNSLEPKKDNMFFELDLGKEYTTGMLRIWNHLRHFNHYPIGFKLESSLDRVNWNPIVESKTLFYFYWAGPRLYPWEMEARLEIRFKPRPMKYLRLIHLGNESHLFWGINEIFVYEWIDNTTKDDTDLSSLISYLKTQRIKYVYADSWLSSQIPLITNGEIQSLHEYQPAIHRSGKNKERIVKFGPDRAFVLKKDDATSFRTELGKLAGNLFWPEMMNSILEQPFGQNIIFTFKPWTDKHDVLLKKMKNFYWLGFCAIRIQSYLSRDLVLLGDMHYKAHNFSLATNYYHKAIHIYPENLIPYQRLSNIEKKIPWKRAFRINESKCLPNYKSVSALFEKELHLTGYQWTSLENPVSEFSAKTLEFQKGEKTSFNFLWQKNIHHSIPNLSVFIHIENANSSFQADHTLLTNRDDPFHIAEQVFLNQHSFEIPSNIAPGIYSIYVGLYTKDGRLKIKNADRPHQRGRLYLGDVKILD